MNRVKALHRIWECDGTDDDVQIQAAIESLPVRTTAVTAPPYPVELRGSFVLGAKIQMPSFTWLHGPARLTSKTNLNDDMIVNKSATDVVGVYITDLDLDGNRANNAGGTAAIDFQFTQNLDGDTDWEPYRSLVIDNVKIRYADGMGCLIDSNDGVGGVVKVRELSAHMCDSYGLKIKDTTDSSVHDCWLAGCYLDGITSSIFSRNYCGAINAGTKNSLDILNSARCRFLGLKVDSFYGQGILMTDCGSLVFSNIECKIGNQLNSDNSVGSIELNNTSRVILSDVLCTQTAGANNVKYNVMESGTSDYNVLDGYILYDAQTADLHWNINGHSISSAGIVET